MRKAQEKLLKCAEKRHLSTQQRIFLLREDLTIQELQAAMDYFVCQPEDIDKDILVTEADRCICFLKQSRKKILSASDYKLLLNVFLYCDIENSYCLIGNKKKFRLFKMYRYLITYVNWSGRKWRDQFFFFSYAFMLYRNFSVWHINLVLRPMILDEERRVSLGAKFRNYPCLMDDYIHNGKFSFLNYLLVDNNFLPQFHPNAKILDKLYDHKNHRFLFANEEFSDYFIQKESGYGYRYEVNSNYVIERQKKQYPIISLIGNFCSENDLTPYDNNNGIFTTWQTWKLMNSQEEKKIWECYKLLGQGFKTDISAFYLEVVISLNFFITVKYMEFKSIYVGANNENGWKAEQISYKTSFMIAPDGRLFQKVEKKHKYIPLKMKSFIELYEKKNICGSLMTLLLAYYIDKNPFYQDVINDFISTKPTMPLFFNEVVDYHNRADLIRKKYKNSLMLNIIQ